MSLISSVDLCRKYAIKRPNLSKLVAQGLVVAKKKQNPRGGPAILMFDEQAFLDWIHTHSREDAVQRIIGESSEALLARQDKQIVIGKSGSPNYTWQTATNSVGALFVIQYNQLLTTMRQMKDLGPSGAAEEILNLAKSERFQTSTVLRTYEVLRRGSKDSAEIEKRRGEVAPVQEMEKQVREMARAVRERVMAMPARITEKLVEAVLKASGLSPEPQHRQVALAAVMKILTAEAHGALQALAGKEHQ